MLTLRAFDMDLMVIATVALKRDDARVAAVKATLLKWFERKCAAATFNRSRFGDDGVDATDRDLARRFRCTSVYVAHQVQTSDAPDYDHIYGAPYVYATLYGRYRFRLSPDAFFQPSVAGWIERDLD